MLLPNHVKPNADQQCIIGTIISEAKLCLQIMVRSNLFFYSFRPSDLRANRPVIPRVNLARLIGE